MKKLQIKITHDKIRIKKSLDWLRKSFANLEKKCIEESENGYELVKELKPHQENIKALKKDINHINDVVNGHKQYSKRDWLELRGMPKFHLLLLIKQQMMSSKRLGS